MAAAVVLIFLVIHFQRKVDSTTIKGGAYNYFGDTKVEYNGSVKLQYKDGTVTAKTEKGKEILDSTPLTEMETDFFREIISGTILRPERSKGSAILPHLRQQMV